MDKEKKKLSLKEIGLQKLIIISLVGIFLIVLSVPDFLSLSGTKNKEKGNETVDIGKVTPDKNEEGVEAQLEERLKNILKKVQGIGEVEVMLTLKTSKERVTLKDEPYTQENTNELDSSGGSRTSSHIEKGQETVLVQSEEGSSVPYVIKEIEPEVEGVVVIAQGGGNPSIINEINSAIEVLFNVPVHKIKVMKMNNSGKP